MRDREVFWTLSHRLFAGALFLLIGSMELQAESLEQWHWRAPLPQGNALHGVSHLNGVFIAIGELGTILTSIDGTNWQRQVSGTSLNLRDCAHGAGKFVVVGDFGTVLTSPDGVSWTSQYAGTFFSLNSVTYAGSQFVAVGEQTTILASPDGTAWTQKSSGNWNLRDVAYANGIFVVVGGDPATANTIATRVILSSPDATMWTVRVLAADTPFHSVAYGAGKFVTTSKIAYWTSLELWSSANGTNWQFTTSLPLNYDYSSARIYSDSGKWIIAAGNVYDYYNGIGEVLISDDLLAWTHVISNTTPVNGIAFGAGTFLAARADGTFLISTNGAGWQNPHPEAAVPAYCRDLKYLNGEFCMLGFNQVSFSADGMTWTNMTTVTNTELLSITYGHGLYVAGSQYRTIQISADGVNWTNPAPGLSVEPYSANVVVAYGNGVFVGASGYTGDILTSADGTNWMVQQLSTNQYSSVYFRDVTFGNNRFVAVSEDAVATSSDGTNWFFSPTNMGVQSVVAGNGLFVAVGYIGIATSTDGTNWVSKSPAGVGALSDVAFGNGFFVATSANIGYSPTWRTESLVWVSKDGINWSRRSLNTPRALLKVAYGNSTFVIAGEAGAVLQSDPLVLLSVSSQLPPTLQLSGPTNRSYQIEYRDDAITTNGWAVLTLLTNSNGPFVDTAWTNSSRRFYRATLLP